VFKIDAIVGAHMSKYLYRFSNVEDFTGLNKISLKSIGSFLFISSFHFNSLDQRIIRLDTLTDQIVQSIRYGPESLKYNIEGSFDFLNSDIYIPYVDKTNPSAFWELRFAKCNHLSLESCSEINPVSETIDLTYLNLTLDVSSTYFLL